jgi:hypothetical protein
VGVDRDRVRLISVDNEQSRTAAFDPLQTLNCSAFRNCDAYSVGAGVPANTGAAGATVRVGFFAGAPAPTKFTVRFTGSYGSKADSQGRFQLIPPKRSGSGATDRAERALHGNAGAMASPRRRSAEPLGLRETRQAMKVYQAEASERLKPCCALWGAEPCRNVREGTAHTSCFANSIRLFHQR